MITILTGDCRTILPTLPEKSVQCCVTSPPYFGLRRYDVEGDQIGDEPTPSEYVAELVGVFGEVKRVLRDDGVLWLNLGDSYAGSWGNYAPGGIKNQQRPQTEDGKRWERKAYGDTTTLPATARVPGLAEKNLIGIPWRVAFALQDDGWILRSDIVWHKPNCMPESVTDRPTRAHEYVFLFAKSARYFYDAAAIAEPVKQSSLDRINQATFDQQTGGEKDYGTSGVNPNRSMRKALENFAKGKGGKSAFRGQGHFREGENGPANREGREMRDVGTGPTRNARTVWSIATTPYKEAHFATFPEELARRCILASSLRMGAYEPDDLIQTPIGEGERSNDPSLITGRAGLNRPRRGLEATRPMSRREQAAYAEQLRYSPYRDRMEQEVSTAAFAHYIRTDASGARPIPPDLLEAWIEHGWLDRVDIPPRAADESRSTVLDPFFGSGTTGRVAEQYGRDCIGIDLGYEELQLKRTDGVQRRMEAYL
jgi:DNA modification methylase